MTNFELLEKFLKLQGSVGGENLLQVKNALILYSLTDSSEFSNYAYIYNLISKSNLEEIEKAFETLNRKSAIYFENNKESEKISNFLVQNNYSKKWEDSWMFYTGEGIDTSRFESIKKVTNADELEIFINTFDLSYQKDDPNNPYGDVKNFIPGCRDAWLKFGQTDKLQYFLAYKNSEPVATSILNSYNGLGYISAVGSIQKVRGEGFGKLATLYAVHESQLLGNTEHVLATEEGTYPNEFYKRIGFETRFTALGYSKK